MERAPFHPFRSADAKERYLSLYDTRAKLWPVSSETMMADTSYGQTFVRISGPAGAPPLILLHGAAATSLMWIPNIRALSAYFRVFAVDNIYDYGRSVYTRPVRTAGDFMEWLLDVCTVLVPGEAVNLMGLSYGGWIAARFALRHPERLRAVVMMAPGATVLPMRAVFWMRVLIALMPLRRCTRSFMFWLFGDFARQSDASRALLEAAVDDLRISSRCFMPRVLPVPTVLKDEEWRCIGIPALFLVGESEKIYSARKAVARLNAVAPRIRTEIIPGAGHDLALVQADMVNRKVVEFLKN